MRRTPNYQDMRNLKAGFKKLGPAGQLWLVPAAVPAARAAPLQPAKRTGEDAASVVREQGHNPSHEDPGSTRRLSTAPESG